MGIRVRLSIHTHNQTWCNLQHEMLWVDSDKGKLNETKIEQRATSVTQVTSDEYDNNSGSTIAATDLGLVPRGLRLKSPLNTQEAIQIVKATRRRLIRTRINDCHRRLDYYNNKIQRRLDKLLPTT